MLKVYVNTFIFILGVSGACIANAKDDRNARCKISDFKGWWITSQTDGKYSVICRGYNEKSGNVLPETTSCEVADRGSDDDNYVVNDNLSIVSPSISQGWWQVYEGDGGCEIEATYYESRGVTTMKLIMDSQSKTGAGWGKYPQGDLFGVTAFRTSKKRFPHGRAS